ncbi:(2Fe-2S) ferredoxin domain-containing protein [Chitinispirillales bacterium ANBcel5]|uniref:(2Fe-2S) ferredoxin domain-containing protein n=1 Tax=Cellulosispirillum alkaliphilum TaxID=3039283 RepID=UPI002A566C8A|nr:(2Fe-2S) ferredoxin domain-containing protein [Chitinispirillales bacterium ANBcel5]
MEKEKMCSIDITICMGSSCYSRGNGKNYEVIREFFAEKGIEEEVKIKGCRCGGQCMNGPNIWVNGEHYSNIDRGSVLDILDYSLTKATNGE